MPTPRAAAEPSVRARGGADRRFRLERRASSPGLCTRCTAPNCQGPAAWATRGSLQSADRERVRSLRQPAPGGLSPVAESDRVHTTARTPSRHRATMQAPVGVVALGVAYQRGRCLPVAFWPNRSQLGGRVRPGVVRPPLADWDRQPDLNLPVVVVGRVRGPGGHLLRHHVRLARRAGLHGDFRRLDRTALT